MCSCCPLQIRGSGLHTPNGPSPLNITEDTPASRLMAQGTGETNREYFYVCSCAFTLIVTHHGFTLYFFSLDPYCG